MKLFIFSVLFICLLMNNPARADYAHQHMHAQMTGESSATGIEAGACENLVLVQVHGLVCDFCGRAIEKVFGRRAEVTDIQVDLDQGQIGIAMNPGSTINDTVLKKLVNDSGYKVVAIKRGC